jgi:anhydro-N-acetylmuramic acid kinase
MDGVDYALCEATSRSIRLRAFWKVPFPAELGRRLHQAARDDASTYALGQLHHDLGRFYACHARRHPRRLGPELVGLHGQTVFHHPGGRGPATLQLGEPAYLVEALGVPVVSNFRAADLACGGQGAPLATLFHQAVFGRRGRHLCVHNLGGISNVTSLDWRDGWRPQPRVLAFDTGPANVLLDLAVRHFSRGRKLWDQDGAWAARGQVQERLLERWLRHPFLARPPPKSTGREMFGEAFFQRALQKTQGMLPEDVLATLTEFTASSVTDNYRRHLPCPPDEVILCGGGAANRFLVRRMTGHLMRLDPATRVSTAAELGWPLQSIEPAAFALLAVYRWQGRAGNLPQTTGARRAVLLGQVAEPA